MDYHLIMDLIPAVARMFFLKQLGDVSLSAAQCVSSRPRWFSMSLFFDHSYFLEDANWVLLFFPGLTAGYRAAAQIGERPGKGNRSPKLAAHGPVQPSHT